MPNLEGGGEGGTNPNVVNENEIISPEVRRKIERMTPATRSMVERVFGMEGVKTLIGKMKVYYSQYFINKDEEKIEKMENEVDAINKKISENKKAQERFDKLIEGYKKVGGPYKILESQQSKLRKEEINLIKERDDFSKKMVNLREKVKSRKETRNEVAKRFDKIYKKRIAPVRRDIEGLEAGIRRLESIIESEQKKYDILLRETAELRSETEKLASSGGLSGRKARKLLAGLEKAEKEPDYLKNNEKELEVVEKSLDEMRGKERSLKDKEKFFEKILKEEDFAQEVSKAKDFEELFKAIDNAKNDEGSISYYSPEQLKETINDVQKKNKNLIYVTRFGGLRSKVRELLENEKKSK